MRRSTGGMGLPKHRKSGKVNSGKNFTGKKGGKRVRRTGKGLTRKQRRLKRGTHASKYDPESSD